MSEQLESALEQIFRKRVRLLGGYTVKLAPTERGIPDRLVIFPGGRMFLVELKTNTGTVSPIQKAWHQKVEKLGVQVYVLYGVDGVINWLRAVITTSAPGLHSKPRRKPTSRVG